MAKIYVKKSYLILFGLMICDRGLEIRKSFLKIQIYLEHKILLGTVLDLASFTMCLSLGQLRGGAQVKDE